jgi:hypothetical protein
MQPLTTPVDEENPQPQIIPLEENLYSDSGGKQVYYFYNTNSESIYKTKEINTNEQKITLYPYTYRRNTNEIKPRPINKIVLKGWESLSDLPASLRFTKGYGMRYKSTKLLFFFLLKKFEDLETIVIGTNMAGVSTRFSTKTITFNWDELEQILKKITKEINLSDSFKRHLVNNELANISRKVSKIEKKLTGGHLKYFLEKFASFEKMNASDVDSLAMIFDTLPAGRIISTSHFIKTKERIETVFLEDIISKFKVLLLETTDNEEKWQNFFESYSWVLSHLFPYQVILNKGKAYLGGKTIEDEKGRIVDFLFKNELGDNSALIEIKTHIKPLVKPNPYRKPNVYFISDELSGGINQCLDQKDIFLKYLNTLGSSDELPPHAFDPKAILVIGKKSSLNKSQAKCFELVRANQKHVDIVTFDELLSKLEILYKVITGAINL